VLLTSWLRRPASPVHWNDTRYYGCYIRSHTTPSALPHQIVNHDVPDKIAVPEWTLRGPLAKALFGPIDQLDRRIRRYGRPAMHNLDIEVAP
jgi:hypothetical protein